MACRTWMLSALLVAAPAIGDETEFQGHALELEGPTHARQVLRLQGSRYSIRGTPAQIVGKAQLCLGRKDSGAGVVAVDPGAGRVVAISRVPYRQERAPRILKGQLTVEAGDGSFSVLLSNLGVLQDSPPDADEVFAPVLLRGDSGWEPALGALLGVERSLVDCMFS